MKIKWRKKTKQPKTFRFCSLFVITYEAMERRFHIPKQLVMGSRPVMRVRVASSSRQFSKSNMFQSGLIRAVSKCCYAEWSLTQHEHHHVTRIMSLRPDGVWEKLCCIAVSSLLVLYLNVCSMYPLSVIYSCKLRKYFLSTRQLNPQNVNTSGESRSVLIHE